MLTRWLRQRARIGWLLIPTAVVLAGMTGIATAGSGPKPPEGVTVYINNGAGAGSGKNIGSDALPPSNRPVVIALLEVPPGTYVINGKVSLRTGGLSEEEERWYEPFCFLDVLGKKRAADFSAKTSDVVLHGVQRVKRAIIMRCGHGLKREVRMYDITLTAMRVSKVLKQGHDVP